MKSQPKFHDDPKALQQTPTTFEILNNVESDMFDSTEGKEGHLSPTLHPHPQQTTSSKGSNHKMPKINSV